MKRGLKNSIVGTLLVVSACGQNGEQIQPDSEANQACVVELVAEDFAADKLDPAAIEQSLSKLDFVIGREPASQAIESILQTDDPEESRLILAQTLASVDLGLRLNELPGGGQGGHKIVDQMMSGEDFKVWAATVVEFLSVLPKSLRDAAGLNVIYGVNGLESGHVNNPAGTVDFEGGGLVVAIKVVNDDPAVIRKLTFRTMAHELTHLIDYWQCDGLSAMTHDEGFVRFMTSDDPVRVVETKANAVKELFDGNYIFSFDDDAKLLEYKWQQEMIRRLEMIEPNIKNLFIAMALERNARLATAESGHN